MLTTLDERALCDAIMDICGGGRAQTIEAIVAGLNARNVPSPGDAPVVGRFAPQRISAHGAGAAQAHPRSQNYRRRGPCSRIEISSSPPRPGSPQPTVAERTETLLATGLRNRWYLIASSDEIANEPVGITRLGENIVLWRDPSGAINADRGSMPTSRASSFRSAASLMGCCVARITASRSMDTARSSTYRRFRVALSKAGPCSMHYPTSSSNIKRFSHISAMTHIRCLRHTELPPELVRTDWSGMLYSDVWHANYRYIYDNLVDPMHTPYLHGETYTLQYGKKNDKIAIRETGHGFETYREGQTGVNADCLEWVESESSVLLARRDPASTDRGSGAGACASFSSPLQWTSTARASISTGCAMSWIGNKNCGRFSSSSAWTATHEPRRQSG